MAAETVSAVPEIKRFTLPGAGLVREVEIPRDGFRVTVTVEGDHGYLALTGTDEVAVDTDAAQRIYPDAPYTFTLGRGPARHNETSIYISSDAGAAKCCVHVEPV